MYCTRLPVRQSICAAKAPLIERAERDADQRHGGGEPAPAGLPAHRPIMQDQHHAGEPEQQPAPLQRRDALAEPAVGDASRSGSAAGPESAPRARPESNARSRSRCRRDRIRAPECRRRRCGAMPIRSGHRGRAIATMIAISTTTAPCGSRDRSAVRRCSAHIWCR